VRDRADRAAADPQVARGGVSGVAWQVPEWRPKLARGGNEMRPSMLRLALVALCALLPAAVSAQDYPTQDIRLICAFPAGGGADVNAAMKQKGDRATYATSAPTGRIMGELYKSTMGLKAIEVNYRTAADSLNEMLSGKVDYGMHEPVFALAQAREGRFRILAVG